MASALDPADSTPVERVTAPVGGAPLAVEEALAELAPGALVAGKYVVGRELGRGGMGVVYEATHDALGAKVALKLVTSPSAEAAERLVREARIVAALDSPRLARVLDVGSERGATFIAMERLEGATLADRLRDRGPLAVAEAVEVIGQVCEGVAAAHDAGVVHRDIKPANVFLARSSANETSVKLLDFGVAKDLGAERPELTRESAVLGSPFYMAPEQVRSARDVDPRADVWSIGVTLYEALSGALPFRADTTAGVLAAVVADAPRPLREAAPAVPAAIAAVVDRCLAKAPEARFADARALGRALAEAARPRPRSRAPWIAAAVVGGGIVLVLALALDRRATAREAPPSPVVERTTAPTIPISAEPRSTTTAAPIASAPTVSARPTASDGAPRSPPTSAAPAATTARPDIRTETEERL